MDLQAKFTENERKTRKYWLTFFVVGLGINVCSWIYSLMSNSSGVEFMSVVLGISFALNLFFSYLMYAFCYRKQRTLLLTWTMISYWAFLATLSWTLFFPVAGLEFNLWFGFLLAFSTANYVLTRRMRHLNKAMKGYAKFPEESQAVAASLQMASNKEELQSCFEEMVKKRPKLKWVLRRERNVKAESFGS